MWGTDMLKEVNVDGCRDLHFERGQGWMRCMFMWIVTLETRAHMHNPGVGGSVATVVCTAPKHPRRAPPKRFADAAGTAATFRVMMLLHASMMLLHASSAALLLSVETAEGQGVGCYPATRQRRLHG